MIGPIINTDTYVFNFGKHKGETYQEVLEKDPGYIRWCYLEVDWFNLTDGDYDEVCDAIGQSGRRHPHRGYSRPYEASDFGMVDDSGYGPGGNMWGL